MKTIAMAFATLTLTLAACGGGGGGGGKSIKIKAQLPAPPTAAPSSRAIAAYSAADAVKVIITSGDGSMVSPVKNGAFEVDAAVGKPAGIVLVGPGDSYLGFVVVRGTIPVIPVQAADPDVTTIDLGRLVENGRVLEPGTDPVGHGLTLGDAEIQALSQLGFVARVILAAPDVDADGAIDFLQGRVYSFQVNLMRQGAMVGLTGQAGAAVTYWGTGFNVTDDTRVYPPTVTFSAPAGAGVGPWVADAHLGTSGNAGYFTPQLYEGAAPPAGTWSASYAGRTLAWTIPDLAGLGAAAPTLVPTLTLNADMTVKSVAWTWRFGDGSTSARPVTMATRINIQLVGTGPRCAAASGAGADQIYSANAAVEATEHQLACQNIPWTSVRGVQLLFTDVFNNNHTVWYDHP